MYSITLVLRFRDVFNDTNTLPLRRWEKFDSTIPILDEISPHPKSHPEKKIPRQDEPVQPDMEAKPRQDSVSPNPPPSPSGIDTTRHDVRVVPRTYSSWLVLSNALVHWHGRMDGWHSLHFYYRSCLTSATHDVRDCVFGGTGRQRWRRGGGASDVPMGMGRGVVWLVVRAGVRGLKDGGLLRRSGWWCDGWLPVVVVGRRWFAFSACLGLCHVEYLVWWLGESTGWVTGSRETMSWWRCVCILHMPNPDHASDDINSLDSRNSLLTGDHGVEHVSPVVAQRDEDRQSRRETCRPASSHSPMGIQTRDAMARLSEALHAKASCEEGFRHSRPGLAGIIGSWAPRRCSVVFSRGLRLFGSLFGGGHGHNHMESHVIFRRGAGHPLEAVGDAACRRRVMMTVEGNLLGGTRVWSREWWTDGDLRKDHQRFRCGTWRPPRCRNLGAWSCGENSWLTIDHDKRQMRTDHAPVRRHAETPSR